MQFHEFLFLFQGCRFQNKCLGLINCSIVIADFFDISIFNLCFVNTLWLSKKNAFTKKPTIAAIRGQNLNMPFVRSLGTDNSNCLDDSISSPLRVFHWIFHPKHQHNGLCWWHDFSLQLCSTIVNYHILLIHLRRKAIIWPFCNEPPHKTSVLKYSLWFWECLSKWHQLDACLRKCKDQFTCHSIQSLW